MDKLLKIKEVEDQIGFKKSTIYNWIHAKEFPNPLRINGSNRWLASDIEVWIEKQVRRSRRKE